MELITECYWENDVGENMERTDWCLPKVYRFCPYVPLRKQQEAIYDAVADL